MELTVPCDTFGNRSAVCLRWFYSIHPIPLPSQVQEDSDALRVIFIDRVEMDHKPLLSLQGFKTFGYLEIASRTSVFQARK